jgi:F-type H+-transporting ATPase subunit epsilon
VKTFSLTIGTPDGLLFSGEVERVMCRSITGDLAILADHCNFCTALGMGGAYIRLEDGTQRDAACIGGMITMMDGKAHLLATTWEWEEDIDVERAKAAKERAEQRLADSSLSEKEAAIAQAKLNRALVRLSVKNQL